ncbi:MAG: hypothetical protein JO147_15315 [Actinobacteria bacterium]|nr:hypothetical protein [Actinomycetota bacterium]
MDTPVSRSRGPQGGDRRGGHAYDANAYASEAQRYRPRTDGELLEWDDTTTHVAGGRRAPESGPPPRGRRAPADRDPVERGLPPGAATARRTRHRQSAYGAPGWAALIVLLVIAGIGGIIDTAGGNSVKGAFNISLVVASVIAILIVRHRNMFTIVVAPPLVYLFASVAMLWARGGLHNRKVLIDSAADWLVYGFPAIAGATAAVLIVAGIRLITRR